MESWRPFKDPILQAKQEVTGLITLERMIAMQQQSQLETRQEVAGPITLETKVAIEQQCHQQ